MTNTRVKTIPAPRTASTPPYAATLEHCELVRAKITRLEQALAEAADQLFTCAAREYRAGRRNMRDLAHLHAESYRLFGRDIIFAWDEIMPVSTREIGRFRLLNPEPNGPGGRYWIGEYPFSPADEDGPFPERSLYPPTGVPVVYVLYDAANEPIYVGSTERFAQRLSRHRLDGKPFTSWLAYPCDSREAAYLLEGGLLAARKPPLNVKVGR